MVGLKIGMSATSYAVIIGSLWFGGSVDVNSL